MNSFPLINIYGDALQRGRQHGEFLKSQIKHSIDFYHSIFKLSEEEIFQYASNFEQLIGEFNPTYCKEINAIAEGADVKRQWIYALNSRTEILSHSKYVSQECTSIYFQKKSILGQNWDWGKALEPLTVLMNIQQQDGHVISMITEPGIIGKIGMNIAGLGVCLNILTLGEVLDGLPIHIVLRAILDCRSIDEVSTLLNQNSNGKASNIIVADGKGNGFDMEFCGDRHHRIDPINGFLIHTNHYLGEPINSPEDEYFFSSFVRYQTANQLLSKENSRDTNTMCRLLSDDSDEAFPIYRDYVADESVHDLGTVCSIVMDLAAQQMRVRKGKSANAKFIDYRMTDVGLALV